MAKSSFKTKQFPSHSSSKANRREQRRAKRRGDSNVYDIADNAPVTPRRNESVHTGPIQYKTDRQKTYHQMILSHTLTMGMGPAGTGKTHIAATAAAIMLLEKKIETIIVSRPAVESGRGLGFLPGELEDKWAPYFKPVRRILEKRLGVSHVENLIRNGVIQIAPLEFLRGDTFENAFVMLDEAQNTTCDEMKTFLTRIGDNCKVVVDGDVEQIDIKEPSGLVDALERLRGMRDYSVMEFEEEDIVRHGIVREVIKRYRS